jgi:protein phosphatase
MDRPRLELAWRSDRGLVRKRNEDAVLVDTDVGVLVVADGIGGASAGDVASRLAAEVIVRRFRHQPPSRNDPQGAQLLAETAIDEANAAILAHARDTDGCSGMGTTVVVCYLGDDWLVYAHVGDSRLYRLRDGRLEQLTRDHSMIQELVDQGFFADRDQARQSGVNDNILTRAVGSGQHPPSAPTAVSDLTAGDIFLLCTDGLTSMLPAAGIELVLAADNSDLDEVADALVHMACDAGGVDNITLALVRVNADAAPA